PSSRSSPAPPSSTPSGSSNSSAPTTQPRSPPPPATHSKHQPAPHRHPSHATTPSRAETTTPTPGADTVARPRPIQLADRRIRTKSIDQDLLYLGLVEGGVRGTPCDQLLDDPGPVSLLEDDGHLVLVWWPTVTGGGSRVLRDRSIGCVPNNGT